MKTRLLKEQKVLPTKEILENTLGESYLVFKEFMEIIANNKFELVKECGNFNDSASWLCKVCHKKETVFWLSILDNFFKVGFYFTRKSVKKIAELDIDNNLKKDVGKNGKIGKLIPLVVTINKKEQIDDVIKIFEYKIGLKKIERC